MEMLLLTALREDDFGLALQQMSSLLSSDLDKFKLEAQLKTLIHIVDEKQVGIKDAMKVISLLNACQKLLVSEVLKLVKLILTVPTTNAVSERSYSTLCKVKPYIIYGSRTSKFLLNCCYL